MRTTMRPTVPDRPPEPTGSRPAPDQMRSSVQPSQILHAIRRNLVACLVILLVCILAGLGVALATKPVAAATTTLGIQPKSKETPSFSTQAKDLMPTLVELSTSPKVLDPAAANLNMETTDLSDALTVTNPPETLVLSITAKAGSKQEAVDMAQATADSLNKELSSGELLGKQALGMTTSTTSPATTANTTMERPGAQAAAISGLLLGLLASVSYAMFRHRRDSGHSGDSGSESLPGRTAAALNALRQKTSDLLRPGRPPAQPQVQAQPPYQYQQIPAPTSPEVPVAPAPGAMATQSASSSMPSPVPAPSFSNPRSQQQTTAMPAISDSAYSAAQPVHSAQEPARAPAPPPSSVSPVPATSSTRSPVSMSAAPLSSASGGAASAPDPAHSFASGITSALQRQRAYQPAPVTPAGTASSQSAPDATASYRHAPLPPPLPTPADLTVPASPSIAVQPYTTTPSSGSHRFPGAPDGPTRRSTALPTGQTVSASSGSSASPASSAASVGSSYQYPPAPTSPPAPAPASSSTGSPASATPATGRRRAPAPTSTSAPSVPTRRRITSPSADRPVAATGWQDASSLPTTTSRRRVQPVPSAPEPPVAAEASRGAVRKQDSASETGSSSSSPSTSMRQQAPSRRQTLARRRRMSKPRLTLVTPLSEESSIEQTRHLAPVPTSASGRHRSPDPPDAPPPPPPPSIQPGQQMASASSAAAATRSAPAPGASAASAGRRAQSTGRSW